MNVINRSGGGKLYRKNGTLLVECHHCGDNHYKSACPKLAKEEPDKKNKDKETEPAENVSGTANVTLKSGDWKQNNEETDYDSLVFYGIGVIDKKLLRPKVRYDHVLNLSKGKVDPL